MTDTKGTVTGAGDPRAADHEGAGEPGERDLFPDQKVSGEGPAVGAEGPGAAEGLYRLHWQPR